MKFNLNIVYVFKHFSLSKQVMAFMLWYILSAANCFGTDVIDLWGHEKQTSTKEQAEAFVGSINRLETSKIWPGINPDWFLRNLKTNIHQPIVINPGDGTYFCAYSAITYLMLQDDPLGYAKFVLALFKAGKAEYRGIKYKPSVEVKRVAGLLRYKGIMDIHPVDQMWYLTMADHYKGYLNLFNHTYDPGDENNFWASVNYAKFNRMAKKLLYARVSAKGTDLVRPGIKNLFNYLVEKLSYGKVVLYINNRIVHKKKHVRIKLAVPTHFIVLEKISKVNDKITLVYWDNGAKTLLQLSPAFLKRIIYGITVFTHLDDE